MSTAKLVPETHELTGDDAWSLLKKTGWGRVAKDSFKRLKVADGFSHARSLAYLMSLVAIEGMIGVVGLASVLHKGGLTKMIDATIRRMVPGPASRELTTAVTQAHLVAAHHQYTALLFGAIGGLIVATTAMAQLERGFNRIYGIEQDRPTWKKYGIAFLLALSVGTLISGAFVSLVLGGELFVSIHNHMLTSIWTAARWPFGLVLTAIAVTVLFRWSPRRRQPGLSWLAFGAGISVLLWGLVTVGLGFFYSSSSSFGKTYGALAGLVALLVWSLLSSVSLFYGAAVAAQLEAQRIGQSEPQDGRKVAESDPSFTSPRPSVLTRD